MSAAVSDVIDACRSKVYAPGKVVITWTLCRELEFLGWHCGASVGRGCICGLVGGCVYPPSRALRAECVWAIMHARGDAKAACFDAFDKIFRNFSCLQAVSFFTLFHP